MEVLDCVGACFVILVISELAFSVVCNIIRIFRVSVNPSNVIKLGGFFK